MVVPARHREPARSGEAGGPPGNRRVLVSVPERYVAGADTRGRQASGSERRMAISVVGASNS